MITGSDGVARPLQERGSHNDSDSVNGPSESPADEKISFCAVASVDARTLPLVMLQSKRVCLVVEDMSDCHPGTEQPSVSVPKICPAGGNDVSFQQLMVHLAQLHRMLVSAAHSVNNMFSCLSPMRIAAEHTNSQNSL